MNPKPKLTKIVSDPGSASGKSPALFQGDDNNFYVQGYIVDTEIVEAANTPGGEALVRVSESFLSALKNAVLSHG